MTRWRVDVRPCASVDRRVARPPIRIERYHGGWRLGIVVGGLLVLHVALAVDGVRGKSTMFDEIAHVAAGLTYWRTGDIRLQPEGGNLPQRWATLPLHWSGVRLPSLDRPAWWASDAYAVGYHLFYDEGNDLEAMLLTARTAMAMLSVPLGLLVFAWSRRLFGTAGALVSLTLYALSPTMLAHAPLVNSDLTASLFFLASLWALWVMLERPTVRTVLLSALAMAGLFLSKNSAPIMLPVAAVLALVRLGGSPPGGLTRGAQLARLAGAAFVHLVVVVALVWAFHGFRYEAFADAEPGRDRLGWETVEPIPAPIAVLREHRLMPEAWLYAYAYVLHHAQARRAFLAGAYSLEGWWWYFPYNALVKTPLPLFALLGLALAGGATSRRTLPLWVFLAAYWATALASHLNAGHRHLLPVYPVTFVLAGATGTWLVGRRRVLAASVAILVGLFAVESFRIRPHYLAYFNQLVGGPRNGWRHLVDSSLDWGQDLPGLARWLAAHDLGPGSATPVYLSYFGTGKPEHYGIEAIRLPGYYDHWREARWHVLRGGVYCISATMLQTVFNPFPGPWAAPYERAYQERLAALRELGRINDPDERARLMRALSGRPLWEFEQLRFARLAAYLRQREPDDQVGWSILIWRLSDAEVREATEGPPVELVPEAFAAPAGS